MTINFSKEHLVEVGTLHEVDSPTYGKYYLRCVANIDWFPPGMDTDEYFKWAGEFHPMKLFVAVKLITVDQSPGVQGRYVSVLLALEEDNKEWYNTNKTSEYATYKGRKCKLPVAMSNKTLKKWLDASVDVIMK